jgi:hypothetical protein
LSWQILHEFYANAVRKTGIPAPEAREAVTLFTRWMPGGMSVGVVQSRAKPIGENRRV